MVENKINHHLKRNITEFIFGLFVTAVILWILSKVARLKEMSPAALRDYIRSFGNLAAIIYIVAYIFDTLALFPPMVGFAITAGLVFGPVWGFFYLMIAAMIGTTLAFCISRYFGRGLVERLLPKRFKNIDDIIEKRGFQTVLFFRIVPIIPYEILNYVSGLSKVHFKDYFFATLIGLIPGILISVFFGDTLGGVRRLKDIVSYRFIAASILLIIVAALPFAYRYLKKKRR
ncbi:MAG: TVP38/TMEM64 family protein [Candidatus Omnitrophica bacterium]|nr:TVP38/TMEM64 family protein [Candidatus Omnitrophota bacterium]